MKNTELQNTNYLNYLLHLDRLIITIDNSKTTFKSKLTSVITESFEFVIDNYSTSKLYLRVYKAFYCGNYVGILRTQNKLKQPYFEFEFDKQVFYSYYKNFWHTIILALLSEFTLKFHNIRYSEIALDSNAPFFDNAYHLHHNSTKHKGCKKPKYEQVDKSNPVSLLYNETEIIIGGSSKSVVIYNKTDNAEDYIKEFFQKNGLGNTNVNRLECRFDSSYLYTFQKRHNTIIDLDSLADDGKLSELFMKMVKRSVEYKVLTSRSYNKNRNPKYKIKSLLEGIELKTKKLVKYNTKIKVNHYKKDSSYDIIKKMYYQYLENDRFDLSIINKYAKTSKTDSMLLNSWVNEYNKKYNGNKTGLIISKMKYAEKFLSTTGINHLKFVITSKIKGTYY